MDKVPCVVGRAVLAGAAGDRGQEMDTATRNTSDGGLEVSVLSLKQKS